MARVIDKQKAIELRKQGKTYGQIKKELNVNKSTLSDWLSKYSLSKKQLALLGHNREYSRQVAIEKTIITKQKKHNQRLNDAYQIEKKRWKLLTKREIELAGIFLYWGEGAKLINGPISLNNTDPQVLKFTLYWLTYALEIPKAKIEVFLHLYNDMDIKKEMEYWSKELKMPLAQFAKPYIKESSRVGLTQKGFGHGTCGLRVSNILQKEKIMMAIKAISDNYALKLEAMV
jgi:transposase-like protein